MITVALAQEEQPFHVLNIQYVKYAHEKALRKKKRTQFECQKRTFLVESLFPSNSFALVSDEDPLQAHLMYSNL